MLQEPPRPVDVGLAEKLQAGAHDVVPNEVRCTLEATVQIISRLVQAQRASEGRARFLVRWRVKYPGRHASKSDRCVGLRCVEGVSC